MCVKSFTWNSSTVNKIRIASVSYGCLPVNTTEIVSGTSKNCTCYTEINGYDNSSMFLIYHNTLDY